MPSRLWSRLCESIAIIRRIQADRGGRLSTGEVDDLWASFNEPDPQPSASASTTTVVKGVKKIKIQVAYEFVGETVL